MSQQQIDSGEQCRQCGAYIVHFKNPGRPCLCYACKQLAGDDECAHPSRLRCPRCRTTWDPWDGDDYELLSDGPHEVTCPDCDHTFEVTTRVAYTFTSAAIEPETEPEPDQDEDEDTEP